MVFTQKIPLYIALKLSTVTPSAFSIVSGVPLILSPCSTALQKQVPVGTVYNAYARYMYIFTFAKKNHLRGAVFVGCEIVIAVRSGRVGVAFIHPKSALTVNSALTFYCDIFLLYCVYKVRACYPFR